MRTYTVRYPVTLHVSADDHDPEEGYTWDFHGIDSADAAEHALLSENGEWACWNGSVTTLPEYPGALVVEGADRPCGGGSEIVRLVLPLAKIRAIKGGDR